MPCSSGIKIACRKLPAWAVSVEQLHSLNRCNELKESIKSVFSPILEVKGVFEEKTFDTFGPIFDAFRLSDPRRHEDFLKLSAFSQFALLFKVFATATTTVTLHMRDHDDCLPVRAVPKTVCGISSQAVPSGCGLHSNDDDERPARSSRQPLGHAQI